MKRGFVYILSSKTGTLYVGVTNNLERRMYEHRNKITPGFTKRYNIDQLIYFEEAADIASAIAREKQLKGWRRLKKLELARRNNPMLKDLSDRSFDFAQDDGGGGGDDGGGGGDDGERNGNDEERMRE